MTMRMEQARMTPCAMLRNCFIGLLCLLSFSCFGQLWVTGYYPGWVEGSIAASNLEFLGLTHVIHFSVVLNSNATLDSSVNGLSAGNSSEVVSRAHAAGRKVLV